MVRFLFGLVLVGAALAGLLAGSLSTGAATVVRLRMMPSTDWMDCYAHLHCKFHGACEQE